MVCIQRGIGFFTNASNIALTKTNINVNNASTTHIHNNHSAILSGSSELSKLYKHCAPGAFLNSAERPNPPKCSPKTRQRLLIETKGFAKTEGPTSSAMWLTGSAGSGKTAISQTTAEQLKEEGYVLGCHFFFRSSKDGKRGDGHCWVPNLVHEMVRVLPETLPYVEKIIRSDDSVFDQQPDGVLEELFLGPLKAITTIDTPKRFSFRRTFKRFFGIGQTTLTSTTHNPRLVVVDGLDECKSPEMQVYILKTIANVIPKLPIPIRFLIASRPETHIRAAINDLFSHIPLHRINLDEDQDIRKDLEEYYHDRFNAIRRDHPSLRGQEAYQTWPSQEQIEALIAKSATQFIFASTVMNYISHHRGNPVTRLEVVLGIKVAPQKDKPYLELDILYHIILLTVQEDERKIVFLILSFIYLAGKGEYPDLQLRASPKFLEQLLRLEVGDVARYLDPLVSILSLPEAPRGTITMLHASFFDYLCDPVRSEDLTMKFDMAHEVMALQVFDEGERSEWQPSGIPSSVEDSGVLASNCIFLDSFLLHASKAHMSLDLILRLFALEQHIIRIIHAFIVTSPYNQQELTSLPGRRSRIDSLLVSKLGGRPTRHESLFNGTDAWSEIQQHRLITANLIIQSITSGIEENTLTSFISQLESGLENGKGVVKPCLSGKLTNQIAQPLILALLQAPTHILEKLRRRDVVKLLEDPARIIHKRYMQEERNYAKEILHFIQEFMRVEIAGVSPGSIIELEARWTLCAG
ncbi:hypothetical protein CPB83DRAFT_858961 [Crepidotus variabilis]|uniref:Nephrocystin 3-like N-terminal domain-containing protein n=1 Tax=Crepidotus variabilis TaxID=179855 RepID=A0A9P6JM19_9AGAR|nr:hypothetical protein CPB83DRAFT_858961 [Crepidotus variabilis]